MNALALVDAAPARRKGLACSGWPRRRQPAALNSAPCTKPAAQVCHASSGTAPPSSVPSACAKAGAGSGMAMPACALARGAFRLLYSRMMASTSALIALSCAAWVLGSALVRQSSTPGSQRPGMTRSGAQAKAARKPCRRGQSLWRRRCWRALSGRARSWAPVPPASRFDMPAAPFGAARFLVAARVLRAGLTGRARLRAQASAPVRTQSARVSTR